MKRTYIVIGIGAITALVYAAGREEALQKQVMDTANALIIMADREAAARKTLATIRQVLQIPAPAGHIMPQQELVVDDSPQPSSINTFLPTDGILAITVPVVIATWLLYSLRKTQHSLHNTPWSNWRPEITTDALSNNHDVHSLLLADVYKRYMHGPSGTVRKSWREFEHETNRELISLGKYCTRARILSLLKIGGLCGIKATSVHMAREKIARLKALQKLFKRARSRAYEHMARRLATLD